MPEVTLEQKEIPKQEMPGPTYQWFLLGLIVLQWFLFRSYVLREIAWAYPVYHDQSTYLLFSYQHFETFLQNDFLNGLSAIIVSPNSNGILLHLETIPLFLLFGASRLSALSANFLNFALYQVVFTLVIKRLSRSQSLALIGAGLLLGTGTPFFWAGGLTDYRLDFAAFCLFGLFISVVMHSEIFRSRKWAIAAGLVAGLLVLTRFITAVYLTGIYGLMFAYFLSEELRRRPPQKTYDRVKNITLSGVTGAMVAGPFLWLNRAPIYGYYFILQQGPERFIRAKEFGAENWETSLLYYPNSIIKDHFTIELVIVSLALIILGITLAYGLTKLQPLAAAQPSSYPFRDAYIFLLGACLLVVLGVLTANTSKSPVVGGIVVPVLLWLVILTVFFGVKSWLAADDRRFRAVWVVVAGLSISYGVYHQVANLGKHAPFTARRPEVKAIEQIYVAIGGYSEQMGWSTPTISTDSNADYLASRALAVRYYEEHGVLLDFQHLLGGSIFSITIANILEQLARSDFVILTHAQVQSPYPFYQSIRAARPQMETFIREHFVHMGRYYTYGNNVDLYARPSFRIVSGVSGDRLTSDRLALSLPFPVAAAASEIVLSGPLTSWISPETTISCVLLEGNQEVETLAAEFTVATDQYAIHCHLPDTLDTPKGEAVQIGLSFSHYIVPEKLGANEDSGQLVVPAPTQKSIVLKHSGEQ